MTFLQESPWPAVEKLRKHDWRNGVEYVLVEWEHRANRSPQWVPAEELPLPKKHFRRLEKFRRKFDDSIHKMIQEQFKPVTLAEAKAAQRRYERLQRRRQEEERLGIKPEKLDLSSPNIVRLKSRNVAPSSTVNINSVP